jgi:hypothetical protein
MQYVINAVVAVVASLVTTWFTWLLRPLRFGSISRGLAPLSLDYLSLIEYELKYQIALQPASQLGYQRKRIMPTLSEAAEDSINHGNRNYSIRPRWQ